MQIPEYSNGQEITATEPEETEKQQQPHNVVDTNSLNCLSQIVDNITPPSMVGVAGENLPTCLPEVNNYQTADTNNTISGVENTRVNKEKPGLKQP